jgi:hypothetical protein
MDLIRQDTRQFFHSKVYHCKGDRLSVIIEGKKLYEGFKLSGNIESEDFRVMYESNLLEEIDSDYDAQKYNVICSLKLKFKHAKLKESFEWVMNTGAIYFVEIYYLKATSKILIKVAESFKEEVTPFELNKLQSKTKPKIMDENEPNTKIIQLITLTFAEINHPEEELKEAQVRGLINLITFSKLRKADKFYVDPISQMEVQMAIHPHVAKASGVNKWSDEILSSERSPHIKTAFSELNMDIRSAAEEKEKKQEGNLKSLDDGEKTSMLPSLKWEFNMNISSPNPDIDEEHEAITHHASSIHDNEARDGTREFLDHSLDLINKKSSHLLELKKLKNRLSLKPIMFALYTFNSLRRKQKRLTTPVLSVKKTDEMDSVVPQIDKDHKIPSRSGNERMKTRLGINLDLVITKPEREESNRTDRDDKRSRSRFKTVISQVGNTSLRSNNPDLQLEDYQKSGKFIRDNSQVLRKGTKFRRSTVMPKNSRVLTKGESIDGIGEDKFSNHIDPKPLSQNRVIRKMGTGLSQVSQLEPQMDQQNDFKNDLGTVTSPGGDSIPKFFNQPPRSHFKNDNEKPKDSFFKMHTVKKESSSSAIELPEEPKTITRQTSFSIEAVERQVPLLEPPLAPKTAAKRNSLGLKSLPREDSIKLGMIERYPTNKIVSINTGSSDNDD